MVSEIFPRVVGFVVSDASFCRLLFSHLCDLLEEYTSL